MKLAYLILAHSDPTHLKRLIGALDGDHANFLIHIDRKSEIKPFRRILSVQSNVRLSKCRIRVHWATFSIVQATLVLMKEALLSYPDCEYFILLSGLDYPIKPNEFIIRRLGEQKGKQYIRYLKISENDWLQKKIKKFWYPEHYGGLRAKLFRRIEGRIWRHAQERVFREVELYHGSQWWMLTHDCVVYILDYVRKNRHFSRFYRFTQIPDEMFFHTIVMNSPFGLQTNRRSEYLEWDYPKIQFKEYGDHFKYIDFSVERERPAVLDESDYRALCESNYLFARKFKSEKSEKLLDLIDRELLS